MTLSSKELSQLYAEDYFFGKTSGYPKTGYAHAHPDWKEYVDFIHSMKGFRIKWLDVGCAFGFLLRSAREKKIAAFGVDISSYALKQVPDLCPGLAQSLATDLPFPAETFDVVTAFDLVEHLHDPRAGLTEMVRVLKDTGVLLFSTPDPILFKRAEQTHVHERPPSFWMEEVKRRGLKARLRFYGEPYNLEIIAIKERNHFQASPLLTCVHHDYFGDAPDILASPSDQVQVVLRSGWSKISRDKKGQSLRHFEQSASLYFCNQSKNPVEVALTLTLGNEAPIRLHTPLENVGIAKLLQGEQTRSVRTDTFSLPPGGHELEITCEDHKGVDVHEITLQPIEKEFAEYNLSLPVDQYQRYRIVEQSLGMVRMNGGTRRVLEVGGTPGQIRGFLPEDDITIVDLDYCDIPEFQPADGLLLPFGNDAFDIVTSIDVFEHVLPENRKAFLSELLRVSKEWVLLGAPFSDPSVREAEKILFEFIHTKLGFRHRFLEEHLRHPLPNKEETVAWFNEQGLHTILLPNGHLSHWLLMMMIYYYLDADPRLNHVKRLVNQYYNTYQYPLDNRSPAYRHLIMASKVSIPNETKEALIRLASPADEAKPADFIPAILLCELINADLLNSGDRITESLRDRNERLQNVIERLNDDAKKQEQDVRELEIRLLSRIEQEGLLMGRIEELKASLDASHSHNQTLQQHVQNLERIVNHPAVSLLRELKRLFSFRRLQ